MSDYNFGYRDAQTKRMIRPVVPKGLGMNAEPWPQALRPLTKKLATNRTSANPMPPPRMLRVMVANASGSDTFAPSCAPSNAGKPTPMASAVMAAITAKSLRAKRGFDCLWAMVVSSDCRVGIKV